MFRPHQEPSFSSSSSYLGESSGRSPKRTRTAPLTSPVPDLQPLSSPSAPGSSDDTGLTTLGQSSYASHKSSDILRHETTLALLSDAEAKTLVLTACISLCENLSEQVAKFENLINCKNSAKRFLCESMRAQELHFRLHPNQRTIALTNLQQITTEILKLQQDLYLKKVELAQAHVRADNAERVVDEARNALVADSTKGGALAEGEMISAMDAAPIADNSIDAFLNPEYHCSSMSAAMATSQAAAAASSYYDVSQMKTETDEIRLGFRR